MSNIREEGGLGGPSYDNFNYSSGAPGFFPNPWWGGPSSPGYQSHVQTMQPRDYMRREDQYAGNQAFAPPGGVNLGGPWGSMMANMMLPMLNGGNFQHAIQNVKPFSSPDMPPLDYMRAKMRSAQSYGKRDDLYDIDSDYRKSAFGKFGDNAFVKAGYDMVNPAGSRVAAFDSIYGRMGTTFGGGLSHQADMSVQAVKDMNSAFSIKSGPNKNTWDWNASHGFDQMQLIDQVDSAGRYGAAGMSKERFASANAIERKKMLGDTSRMYAAAGSVFGKDKGSDELTGLTKNMIEGLAGMDANKATELLNRVQSASRAVDISTKAFAEYNSMFNDLNKRLGGHMGASVGDTAKMAISARAMTRYGQATGNIDLSDQSRNMGAVAEANARFANSPTGKKLQATAAAIAGATDSQLAAIKVPGFGTALDLKKGGLRTLVASGDVEAQRKLNDWAAGGGLDSIISRGALAIQSNVPSVHTERAAAGIADFKTAGEAAMRTNMHRHIAGRMTSLLKGGTLAAINQAGGVDKVMSGMDLRDFGDMNKITRAMAEAGVKGTPEQYSEWAADIHKHAAGERDLFMGTRAGQAVTSTEHADATWSGKKGIGAKGTAEQIRRDERVEALIGEISGDAFRGVGVKDLIGSGIDVLKDLNETGAIGPDGKPLTAADISKPDGDLDVEKLLKLAPTVGKNILKNYAGKVTGNKQMEKLNEVMNPKNLDRLETAGGVMYDKFIKQGKTPEEAQSMTLDKMREMGQEQSRAINGQEGPDPIPRLPVEKPYGDVTHGSVSAAGGSGSAAGGSGGVGISKEADKAIIRMCEIIENFGTGSDGKMAIAAGRPQKIHQL